MITDDPQSILNQAKSIRYNDGSGITDDPQEVLNQAMSIRYKGEYSGGILSRGMQAAQDFGSNAIDALSGWGDKVSNDFSSIKPVQMENRSNEEIQADTDAQNQQLGQLYSDAVANPAGKVAITPWVPGNVRAVAGALYAPQLANDAMNTYQQNSAADEAQGGDGSGMDVAGKTAYDVLVNPVVSPVKEIVTSPGEFGQSIIDDPANIWNKVLLPGAVGHGAYKGGKAVYDGAKDRYGNALGSLDEMDASIPKAPGAAIMDDPMDVLQQARGISAPSSDGVPLGDNAFSYAVEKSGTPYELGGDGVASTDCGKLVQDSFNAAGVDWNNRYVPSMIAEAQEKGAWHPAGDGYIPQKGDAAVVLGDNHVILADGEGGYVGANSSTGVIKKPSIADDFGDVTGYISVDDMTGGRRAQAKAIPQSDPYRTGESDFQPGDDFKAADIPDDNADIFGRNNDYISRAHDAAEQGDYQSAYQLATQANDPAWSEVYRRMRNKDSEAKESALPPKESFMDMPMEKATPQDFENHIYSKIEELPPEQRPIDISLEMKQPKMLTPEEDALKIFNDEAQKAGFPTDKPAEFPAAREFSKAPDYQKIVQDEFADPVDKILGNTPEYARGVNEEMMNKAYEAVSNNDYKAAAELARRAGANDWAKQFDLLDKTAGGSKPVEPRLSGTPTGEYTGDTITKRQIVKRAADLFVPIRTGRIGKADVMGFADHNAGVIRIRDYGNLDTMAHEIGHIADAALGLRGDAGAFDREFSRVVDNRFGKDAYEPAQKRAEGIAEFMKDYLTNENKAKIEMPEYYSQFKAALEKNPDIKGRVNEVKSMIYTWQKQSPEARGRGAVSYADEMKPTVKERAKQAKLKFVEDWVDDKVGLKRVTESYERATGERLATKDDPYKMARLAQNSSVARAQMLVEGDKPELVKAALNKVYGDIIDKGITIKGVLKELDASPELKGRQDYLKEGGFKNWHEALDSLLVARRVVELNKVQHTDRLNAAKVDLEKSQQAYNDALTKTAQAKTKMRAGQILNKVIVKSNVKKARYERDQLRIALNMFTDDARKARDAKIRSQMRMKNAENDVKRAEYNFNRLQAKKEKAMLTKWEGVENKESILQEIDAARQNLFNKKEDMRQAKAEFDNASHDDEAAGLVLKDIQDEYRGANAWDSGIKKEKIKQDVRLTYMSKDASSAKGMESAAESKMRQAEEVFEKKQDVFEKATDGNEQAKNDYNTAKEELAAAQRNYEKAVRLRVKYENRHYYRNEKDIKVLAKAHSDEMIAKAELRTAGRKVEKISAATYKAPINLDDATQIIKNAPKALNDAAQKIYAYNDNILRILKENGMIKPEVYEALTDKYHNYVPMARDFADESGLEKGFGMGGQGFGNVRAALKAISEEGSTRQVVSPLESIVKNTYAMLNLVERNRVGQTFVKMAEGDRVGKLVEEVTGAANTKDSTFSVWVNGEKKVYQTEPEIYRAIMSVNKDTANIITKLLSPPAQLLRAGATLTPDFAIKNIMRDSFSAAVFSRYGFRPIIDHAAGIFHMAKQDALFHEYKASGALMSTMVGLDRDYVQGSLKGLYKKDVAHYWNHYNPVQVLRGFSEMLETATRLGEYSRAVGKGVSVEDAALSARDISLDFSKHGVYGKTANKMIAFFNAGIQEPARILEAFKENPKRTSAQIAKWITLPSVALWVMNYDQQWYKELPAYQKNLFWCFKAGDTIYRVPKPFGLGVIFGSLPERALDKIAPYVLTCLYPEHKLEYMALKDPNGMKNWAKDAASAFLPNFMPTAVGPIMEWATGYSFFQGRDIVPQKEQKLPDELQYGPNTSELAKEIGRIFGVSPRKLDNTISGYGAGLANQTLNIADSLADKREYKNPFQKAFTTDPMKSPQSIQDFYDNLDEVQKMYNGAKATKTKLSEDERHNYNLLNYVNGKMDYLHQQERDAIKKGDTARVERLKREQLKAAQDAMKQVR